MPNASQWILLARILRPQGRRGEVLADLFTERTGRFNDPVWLAPQGFIERLGASDGSGSAEVEPRPVSRFWLPLGRNAGRIVLHFSGIDTIESAEALAGREVVIPAAERSELEPGTVYISDLIGVTVFDRETAVGVIEDVIFPMTPDGGRRLEDAAPLLTIASPAGDEVLVPFASSYIRNMDMENRRLLMELPPGLLDLNRRPAGSTEDPV
jgi:16S rRNA processing protein RimM